MVDENIGKFLDGFLAGDGETANRPEFEELAAIVFGSCVASILIFAKDKGGGK